MLTIQSTYNNPYGKHAQNTLKTKLAIHEILFQLTINWSAWFYFVDHLEPQFPYLYGTTIGYLVFVNIN